MATPLSLNSLRTRCSAQSTSHRFCRRPTCVSVSRDAQRRADGVAARAAASGERLSTTPHPAPTYERVLRYPNGDERRILYPVVEDRRAIEDAFIVDDDDGATAWLTDSEMDEVSIWNECNLAGAACHVLDTDPLVEELAALHHGPKPHNVTELVQSSFQILSGSPWLFPRPVYVLAQQSMFGDHGNLYSMQTRLEQSEVQDELAMVLGRPDISERLTFSRMKDGVVAFDRAEDAARYATCLEAELFGQAVEVMEVDSHHLFTLTGGADAVVVYIAATDFLPMPQQLMQALRH